MVPNTGVPAIKLNTELLTSNVRLASVRKFCVVSISHQLLEILGKPLVNTDIINIAKSIDFKPGDTESQMQTFGFNLRRVIVSNNEHRFMQYI